METLARFYRELEERGFSCFIPQEILDAYDAGILNAWGVLYRDNAHAVRQVLPDVLAYDPSASDYYCFGVPLPEGLQKCPTLPEPCFTDSTEWELIEDQGHYYGRPPTCKLLHWNGAAYDVSSFNLTFASIVGKWPSAILNAAGSIVICWRFYPKIWVSRKRRQIEDQLRKDPTKVVLAGRALKTFRLKRGE